MAVALVRKYVPSDTGDPRFAEITGGDFAGVGSTCGYLPSWLFHRLGCNDARIINRTDLDHGLRYSVGHNIDRLVNGAKALGASRTLASGPPLPGDGVFYSNGPSTSEHVAVVLDASTSAWQTADAGLRNDRNAQCARLVSRNVDPKTGKASFSDGPRSVVAIFDLERIVPPLAPGTDLLTWLGLASTAFGIWRFLTKGGA
jgi:hypothetical protein